MSKLLKIINYYLPLRDWLYILQLEEYVLSRYIKQIPSRICKRNFEQRGQLDFTLRIKLVLLVTTMLILAPLLWATSQWPILLLYLVVLPLITPLLVGVASLIISPIVYLQRQRTLKAAHKYWQSNYPNTKIIAVTGSYGKTTTKYLIHALLEHTYRTAIIPDNLNTTLGAAEYILKGKVSPQSEYLVVEMGAHIPGDIAEFTKMLSPDISIITILGDQHLERFGSFKNLVTTKAEIFSHNKIDAKKFTTPEAIKHLEEHKLPVTDITAVNTAHGETSNEPLAKAVATHLDVSDNFINDALQKFTPPERRNRIYVAAGVTIIDNSYNISPQTAEHTLRETKDYANENQKKLVVMSGGIAEQGKESEEVNQTFGELLNQYADRVIINPTIYHQAILKTLKKEHSLISDRRFVTSAPSDHIKSDTEILLWLPGHTDLAYL